MKPVCTKCQRFYRPKKNGYPFIECMPKEDSEYAKSGTEESHRWTDYKLWMGDLWHCRGCGHELIVGTGRTAIAEHFETDFGETVESYVKADNHGKPLLRVNDC